MFGHGTPSLSGSMASVLGHTHTWHKLYVSGNKMIIERWKNCKSHEKIPEKVLKVQNSIIIRWWQDDTFFELISF